MSTADTEYTIGQIGRIINEREQTLRSWLRRGLLRPCRRTGRTNWFAYHELSRAQMLQSLVRQGMPSRHLARTMARVDESLAEYGGIIVLGSEVAVRNSDGTIANSQGQTLLDFYSELANDEIRSKPPTISAYVLEDAISAEDDEDYERAEKIYQEVLMRDGPNAESCFNLGNVLYQLNRKLEAIQRYRQAVELEPDYLEAWTNLGIALSDVDRTDEAIEVFKRALDIDPVFADALYNIAETFQAAGRVDDAKSAWSAYLRIDPYSSIADGIRKTLAKARTN